MSSGLRLRAPTTDGGVLAVPPLDDVGMLLDLNQGRLGRVRHRLLDRPWAEVRAQARRDLLAAAATYTGRKAPVGPVFLAGHQPELFHPGVWVKNFALAGLARRHGGVAVNFLVDNDSVKTTAIQVPVRGDPYPRVQTVPFDQGAGEVPWEERRVLDAEVFARFGSEVAEMVRPWGYEPIMSAYWADVRRQVEGFRGNLGESLAGARRALESRWGCDNLEVPLSQLCQGEAFAVLAGALLADLPRFVAVYNAVVQEHRRANRIRSRNHPVPDLVSEGGWLEVPLWGWQAQRPRRGRLFARMDGDMLGLRCGEADWPAIPAPVGDGRDFLQGWRDLAAAGYKVRSRALLTTLYARLLLADLFIHGIGGAKYDELTDAIVERYWGVSPPGFLVLSATQLLPVPHFPATDADLRRVRHELRDMRFNPQRHLDVTPPAAGQKQEWIGKRPSTRQERRERFRRIRDLSEAMWPALDAARIEGERDRERVAHEVEANALLRRRDFGFCLYPEATLRPFCTRFL